MCGFCNVCVFFVMCGCVFMGFVMCWCVYVGFVMCGCLYVWGLLCVGVLVICILYSD